MLARRFCLLLVEAPAAKRMAHTMCGPRARITKIQKIVPVLLYFTPFVKKFSVTVVVVLLLRYGVAVLIVLYVAAVSMVAVPTTVSCAVLHVGLWAGAKHEDVRNVCFVAIVKQTYPSTRGQRAAMAVISQNRPNPCVFVALLVGILVLVVCGMLAWVV